MGLNPEPPTAHAIFSHESIVREKRDSRMAHHYGIIDVWTRYL